MSESQATRPCFPGMSKPVMGWGERDPVAALSLGEIPLQQFPCGAEHPCAEFKVSKSLQGTERAWEHQWVTTLQL